MKARQTTLIPVDQFRGLALTYGIRLFSEMKYHPLFTQRASVGGTTYNEGIVPNLLKSFSITRVILF